MGETGAFKECINAEMIDRMAEAIQAVYPDFQERPFKAQARRGLSQKELKERSQHLAECLRDFLPSGYPEAAAILVDALGPPLTSKSDSLHGGFFYWPFADFVARYGLEHPEESMQANYEITRRFTAEFSIRPFIEQHYDFVMKCLAQWVKDPDEHVRRLVSEGTRPRLPWGGQLKGFITDPSPCIPFLDALRSDPSLYVRRSVANHLNDIGKDHPRLALDICRRWSRGASEETWWVIRHALRNHIKQGDADALALLGYAPAHIDMKLRAAPLQVSLGDSVGLEVQLTSRSSVPQRIMLDYRMHFVRKNGKTGIKVFKWRDFELAPQEVRSFSKTHSFRPITTRVYYPGRHTVEIQVNGQVMDQADFELTR